MTAISIPLNVTAAALLDALNEAMQVAQVAASEPWDMPHGECGFAWTSIKMRKNGRLHKVLKDFGFSWNEYYKTWEYCACGAVKMQPGTMWQSRAYRSKIEQAFANCLYQRLNIDADVRSWVD